MYDLYAVTNHFGSLNGGHYTAFGKNPDGNWYNFNDSQVSSAGIKNICSSSAYLLFYRRREDPGKNSSGSEEETKASSDNRRSEKSNDSGKYIYELD
jgi:hypothetical protein